MGLDLEFYRFFLKLDSQESCVRERENEMEAAVEGVWFRDWGLWVFGVHDSEVHRSLKVRDHPYIALI